MDVSLYISELLELHGEVNVPGLGHLAQTRVSGYYNAADFKFYPPHNEVTFDPQRLNENHVLTQYIADKKNISLESSQYFTEKFITNLKEDALYNDVPVANIGWFYNNGGKLGFKANKITNDPEFYGYPAVRASKLLSQAATPPPPAPQPVPVTALVPEPTAVLEPEAAAPSYQMVPERIAETIEEREEPEEELYYEEPRTNRALRTGLIILGVVLVLLIIGYATYVYKPSAFERIENYFQPKKTEVKLEEANTIKADTNTMAPDTTVSSDTTVKKDTAIKTNTPAGEVTNRIKQTEVTKTTVVTTPAGKPVTTGPKPNDVTALTAGPKPAAVPKVKKYGIIVYTAKTMDEANRVVNNYKANGIDVQIVPGKKAPRITITAGSYNTLDEAQVAFTKLIESGKIDKDSYPMELK
jgi:hypothetical protein